MSMIESDRNEKEKFLRSKAKGSNKVTVKYKCYLLEKHLLRLRPH